jgi:hypothetical protein
MRKKFGSPCTPSALRDAPNSDSVRPRASDTRQAGPAAVTSDGPNARSVERPAGERVKRSLAPRRNLAPWVRAALGTGDYY